MKLLWIVASMLLSTCSAYRVLLLLPFPGPSHFLMFKVFIRELVARGHQVTSFSSIPFGEKLENYTEYYMTPEYPLREKFASSEIFTMKFQTNFENMFLYWNLCEDSVDWYLKNPKVLDFIKNDKSHFDLLITEQWFQESWLMFMYKFKDTPMITISSYGYSDFMDRAMGALTPYSFVPHKLLMYYGDEMDFWQRCENFILSIFDVVFRKYYYMPALNRAAHEAFASIATEDDPLPTVEELENRISLMLVNSHWSYTKPRPLMPNMINVGGVHIREPQPLPADIQSFLDGAEHGAIYFSIGSYLQSSSMPIETVQTIVNVFGKLKQRVLWKFEMDLPGKPDNLMIRKWLPQSDILAHPKIALFITHGGIFGMQEGSSRGVPMLFVPFFGDQVRNSMNTVAQGYGLKLNFADITEESLTWHINELLTNKKYSERAKEISRIFNDNPNKAMDEAMFWIDYVVRHKGAKHLHSAATKLPWYKYLSLDVIAFIFAIISLNFWIGYRVARAILRKIFWPSKSLNSKKMN